MLEICSITLHRGEFGEQKRGLVVGWKHRLRQMQLTAADSIGELGA